MTAAVAGEADEDVFGGDVAIDYSYFSIIIFCVEKRGHHTYQQ